MDERSDSRPAPAATGAPRRRIVVIGAGVMGLSCAVEMARLPNAEVAILDSQHPGSGSTSRSVGVYTRQYLDMRDIEIRVRSVEEIYTLESEGLLNLRRVGYMRIGRDSESEAAFERSIEIQAELGVAEARLIEPEEIQALVPGFRTDGIECGLFCPTEGYVDGAELCSVLAERAQGLGASLMVRTKVLGLRRGGTARYQLVTDRGELPADLIVNCAGAWAGQVGEALEAPVDIVNERHEAYSFQLPPDLRQTVPMVMDYVPGAGNEEGLYFRQEGADQLVAGLHSTDILHTGRVDPDSYFEGVTADHVDTIVERMSEAFPEAPIGYRGGWAGLYPHSADELPIAGPHPDNPDILVGAGLGGVGLSLGPALGKLLADWVRFGEPRALSDGERYLPRVAGTPGASR